MGWQPIEHLIEALAGDADLIEETVRDVRIAVPEVGRLGPEDVARHTRALLAAATRAIAERRGPSTAELDFIEDLAVTRARQGVPIHDVLAAIHVAGRHIWTRARILAAEHGVPHELLMDARELFEDWTEPVRGRLIVAHRRTELGRARSRRDRQTALLHRLVAGGSAAGLAAAEAGLDPAGLWVTHVTVASDDDTTSLEDRLRTGPQDLLALTDDALVGVHGARPRAGVAVAVGLAGPLPADELDVGRSWARRAHDAAVATGRDGIVDVTEVAVAVALRGEPAIGRRLRSTRLAGLDETGEYADELATTVLALLRHDRNVDDTAAALFVHPNTVRHRVKRFEDATGMPLDGTFEAVAAWWAVTDWLAAR